MGEAQAAPAWEWNRRPAGRGERLGSWRPRQPPGRPRELARPPSVTGGPRVGESLEPAGGKGRGDQAPSVLLPGCELLGGSQSKAPLEWDRVYISSTWVDIKWNNRWGVIFPVRPGDGGLGNVSRDPGVWGRLQPLRFWPRLGQGDTRGRPLGETLSILFFFLFLFMSFYPSENFLILSRTCTCMYGWNFNLSPFHSPLPQALSPGREMKLEDLQGLLLEIVELLDCRRAFNLCFHWTFKSWQSFQQLFNMSKGVLCNAVCSFSTERYPMGSARVGLLQRMNVFAESSLCINWSWKEYKNGVLLPLPAWKEC